MEVAATVGTRDGDDISDAAFHDRFEAARPRLMAICRTVVGPDDAEDVVQETYLRARERLGQLRNPRAFEAWLIRIALNEARSIARRRATHQRPLGDFDPASPARDSDLALLQMINELPTRERMAVVLFYGYGYGAREVGRLLGISHINARTVLFRARRRLRKGWEASDGIT
jgi:RNA polymerase sigma factor (sigma-70 family)